MNFFGFPTEIRLGIYSELLVLIEPIVLVLVGDNGPSSLTLIGATRDGTCAGGLLCAALLRCNKKVHSEANPLLYSNNRFQFHGTAQIVAFINQIGSQTSYIRYMFIPFPTVEYPNIGKSRLDVEPIELIRVACTCIRVLVLSFSSYSALGPSPITAEHLDLIDTCLKDIPSLEEIFIDLELFIQDIPSDRLIKKMHDYGWTISVTKRKNRSVCFSDPATVIWEDASA